jgi:hypothetical protein
MSEHWQQHAFFDESETTYQTEPSQARPEKKQRRAKLPERTLRDALAPYLDTDRLRQLASDHQRLEDALRTRDIPEEVSLLLDLLQVVLKPRQRYQIRSPGDVASYLQVKLGYQNQEQLGVLCLDTKNTLRKDVTVYTGNVSSVPVQVREVLHWPVRLNCPECIIYHQHPSEDATPSPEDVAISNQIYQGGVIFDITLLDSLIVTPHSYVSLAQRGLIPGPWKKS